MELDDIEDISSEEADVENPNPFHRFFEKINFSFLDNDFIGTFLTKNDIRKDNIQRFFAWMITFKILPFDSKQWPDLIQNIYNEYQILIKTNLIDEEETPLQTLIPETAAVITADITRILTWYKDMALLLNIPINYTHKAEIHAYRVFALLTHTRPFNYAQGHDRYFIISYLLALHFAYKFGLSSEYAEALTFHLAFALIQMGGISRYLDNPRDTEKHFQRLDRLMNELTPKRFQLLQETGQTSIYFALRWELLIFSDEYDDIDDILFLWDNVIARQKKYEKFIMYLCISHLSQVPIPHGDDMMISSVQQFRLFDVVKAVDDAVSLMGGDREDYSLSAIGISFLVLVLCFFTLKYLL